MPFVVERGYRLVGRLVFVLRCVKAATRILHCLPIHLAWFAAALDAEPLQVGNLCERRLGIAHALLQCVLNFLLPLDSFFDPGKLLRQLVSFVLFFLRDVSFFDRVVIRPLQVADVVEQEAKQPNEK